MVVRESHASGGHLLVGGVEVLHLQEEADPSGHLLSGGGLVLRIGSCQQQACRGAGRPDHHLALGAPVVCPGRGVLHQLKAQTPTKKLIAGSWS